MFAFFRRTKLTRKTTRQRAGSRKPRLEVLEDRVLLNVDLGPIVNPANGHTYYRLMQSNWTDAEREAVSLGGHLATINDQAENDWVYATFHTPQVSLWIGLNDVAAYRDFTWVSGETATYRNWSAGEPHDFGNEDYVEMRDSRAGLWNDLANVDSYTGTTLKGIVEVATPDIDMQSAQLQDAHTVRFTYQTTGNPGPFQVSLYRSTDGITYNPADLIATQPVVSPPENRGSGTFALPSPWIADPDLPYLLVVADPANSISELNENNNSQAVLVPDIAVRDARWVPIQDHHQDASIVRFEYSSVGYDGQVALRLFQSADNTFDSSDVLLQSQTVDVITGQKTIGSFRLESGPSSKVDPNYLVIVAQPLSK